jgi:hypothetical protein
MKRQLSLLSFLGKEKRNRTDSNDTEEGNENQDNRFIDSQNTQDDKENQANSSINSLNTLPAGDEGNNLPDCWNEKQASYFKSLYTWLEIKNGKLGCQICSNYKSLRVDGEKHCSVSKEWKGMNVYPNGNTKDSRFASLRKKMAKHSESFVHNRIIKINKEVNKSSLENLVDQVNDKEIQLTSEIFNSVYSLAKRNRPMSDLPNLIELQIKNGIDLGQSMHSRFSGIRIAEHISEKIKIGIFSKIIDKNSKISVIVDESTTLSKVSVLVVYIQIELNEPCMVFLDLIELENTTADHIYICIIHTLNIYGFSDSFLNRNFISFCSDGASVMLGNKSGVARKLREKFPNIIIWHCAAHRLQLALGDSIKKIRELNHFEIFIDKLYAFYHQSTKNQRELNAVVTILELKL